MQRPRLTERTAEALRNALPWFRENPVLTSGMFPRESQEEIKRALTYLEDLLRWHRARQAECDPSP
jgi:hypothetical protein